MKLLVPSLGLLHITSITDNTEKITLSGQRHNPIVRSSEMGGDLRRHLIWKVERRETHQGKEEKLVRFASLRENVLDVYLPERTGTLTT